MSCVCYLPLRQILVMIYQKNFVYLILIRLYMKSFSKLVVPALLCISLKVSAQLIVSNSLTPQQLVENILSGPGTSVSNITYTGSPNAIGTFDGYFSNIGLIGGVLLTTGNINNAPGPNILGGAGIDNNYPGDTLLSMLSGYATYDAAVLEFDLVPQGDTIRLRFVFASEEYNEYVCGSVNDVFGFFVSGPGITGEQNIALLPGTSIPVSINTINIGAVGSAVSNPDPGCLLSNSGYYVDNTTPAGLTVEYDGFTTVLTGKAAVTPCLTYHLKLAIADGFDGVWDSGVFLETESFMSPGRVNALATIPAGNVGCAPFPVTFQNNSTGTNRFVWDFGDGSPADTATNPSHTFMNPGGYSVQLIAMDTSICGIPDTLFLSVNVDSGIVSASFNMVQSGQCDSIRVDNTTTSRGAQLFSWDFQDGPVVTGPASSHTYRNPGVYIISHVATNSVCNTTDTAYRTVTLLPRIQANIQTGAVEGCNPMNLFLCGSPDSVLAGTQFHWDFANGEYSNFRCDSAHYPAAGIYSALLVVTDSVSCNLHDTAWLDVNVKITPVAEFVDFDSVNVIFPVQFENASVNGSFFQWDFGDGDSATQYEPNHNYVDSGYYNVCMAAFQDECFDTVCHDLKVFRLDQTVWIPAAFTPNGDGRNDYFYIDGLGIASLKMVIVNRWGELVFESNAVDARWDGTVKGTPAISGVYSVRIEAAFFDGASTKQYGSVTLYR